MSMNTSVFEMVHQVLGDAKEKLAADRAAAAQGIKKTAAASQPRPSAKPRGDSGGLSDSYLGKLASACDHLASRLHLIDDRRTPAEKLAEAVAINQALMKQAFEGGDTKHQTTQANPDSISPMVVNPAHSGTNTEASGSNAIPSEPNNAPGESLDAGQSGEAAPVHVPAKGGTTPVEKANPMDSANAMETNVGMMMPDQPEDLLQQGGGDVSTGDKTAAARAYRALSKVTGRADAAVREKVAQERKLRVLLTKAAQSGIPRDAALAMLGLGKHAEDAINPANVQGPTKPVLQQEPGVPSALMQGSEAGSNTPRAVAPPSGEGGGRPLVSTSNERAMGYTKADAKAQNKGALAELLTEPMMSASRDSVLQKSLDNTSSAGVKISAMRSLLKKFAAASPAQAQKLAALAKVALDPEMAAEGGAVPPMAAGAAPEGIGDEEAGEPSPEAMAAAEAGVTPEELAEAEALLAEEAAGAGEEGAVAPPEAGAEEPEKTQQLGMGSPMGAPSMGAAPPPTPMM